MWLGLSYILDMYIDIRSQSSKTVVFYTLRNISIPQAFPGTDIGNISFPQLFVPRDGNSASCFYSEFYYVHVGVSLKNVLVMGVHAVIYEVILQYLP